MRRNVLAILLLAGAALAGCAARNQEFLFDGAAPRRGAVPPAAEPGVAKAAPRQMARITPQDLEDLSKAVEKVMQLRYAEAMPELTALADRFHRGGDVDHAAEAWFWMGYCREKTHDPPKAREAYQRAVALAPGTPAADLAAQRLEALSE
jgi:TolA-binding protein